MFNPAVLLSTLGLIFNTPHEISHLHRGVTRQEYDFIVVGSGSAGAVVAARLSEIKDVTVLLLEAGGESNIQNVMPALTISMIDSDKDWQYRSTKQNHSFKFITGQKVKMAAGKVAGGSSSINFMMYVRGNKQDFNNWAELGNEGWSYNDVLTYFKKMETYKAAKPGDHYRGTNGPITNSDQSLYRSEIAEAVMKAGCELGYQCRHDYNGESQHGFAYAQANVENGERQSTAQGYLLPNKDRPNLDISLNSFALKILFDENKRAHGISYQHGGMDRTVYAKKEIILSAGSIGTAKLLQLSGVGPKEHLQEHKIPLVLDSPGVGSNLQDHVASPAGVFTTDQDLSAVGGPHHLTPDNFKAWLDKKPSPLGTLGADVTGFISSSANKDTTDYADNQIVLMGVNLFGADYGSETRLKVGLSQKAWEVHQKIAGKPGFVLSSVLLHPKSRGTVRLNSDCPYDMPVVEPNYFSHPDEVKTLAEGLTVIMNIAKSKALQQYKPQFLEGPYPGCENFEPESDEFLHCLAKHFSTTVWHYAGTCKMGPKTDKDAVVDNRLRVYGLKGLRVADASIMPLITSGNTNAPTIMIGEKCAHMIKQDWKLNIHDEL